jgi:uncharacterized protein YbaP (TraB family)
MSAVDDARAVLARYDAFALQELEETNHAIADGPVVTALRSMVAQHDEAVSIMNAYMDWYQDHPEDSWRLQRDMCGALGISEADEDDAP